MIRRIEAYCLAMFGNRRKRWILFGFFLALFILSAERERGGLEVVEVAFATIYFGIWTLIGLVRDEE